MLELAPQTLSLAAIAVGALALVTALVLYFRVAGLPEGNEARARIARYIREGAMAFLVAEYKVLGIYAVLGPVTFLDTLADMVAQYQGNLRLIRQLILAFEEAASGLPNSLPSRITHPAALYEAM